MKHTRLTRAFSLLTTLAFLLAFLPAPIAQAAVSYNFITGCQASDVTVYYSPQTNSKDYGTLDEGDRVAVREKRDGGWWGVAIENTKSGSTGDQVVYSTGFVREDSGFLPSGIPTETFIGDSSTSQSTPLYSCPSTTKGAISTLNAGTGFKVIQEVGEFYFVFTSPMFYGYVIKSACKDLTVTAPTVTAAPVTAKASSNAVGFDNLNVASKGKLVTNAMLYGINDMKSNPIAQTPTGGDAQVYYRVANDFYLISTGPDFGFYAYVPAQSITVYDMAAVPHHAGAVSAISGVSNGQTAVTSTAASSSSTATIANCTSWVSMRAKASSSSKRLYKLSKGKSVTVLGKEGSYTKIKYNGKTGYVLSTYVK